MNTKHTAGQWRTFENDIDLTVISTLNSGQPFQICRMNKHAGKEVNEANAKLIAAAPDLLEMCIATLEDLESGELTGNATESAIGNLKDAIKAATE